ncbi:MAG: FAD-dependent oxidoreductase [Lewinellaceae bacterium]|nr:FAD-dependent oxidoreductase [Lewinellaceae bacterium]
MQQRLIVGYVLILFLGMNPGLTAQVSVDVLVLGGGTGGTAAAIQAARSGASTLLVEPTPWLGGMLTAAGVSAVDGNNKLPSGLWGAFRKELWDYYGGPDSVATGWVSNTQFEPEVGAAIWGKMATAESRLRVWTGSTWAKIKVLPAGGWEVTISQGKSKQKVQARMLIDGTDLGDVLAAVGAPYDLGMDSRTSTGESMAPESPNKIIQDFTYVAILQDFGAGTDQTIPMPAGYNPEDFRCSCRDKCPEQPQAVTARQMLDYGKLPGGKYMLNWPKQGNDFYANVVEATPKERQAAYAMAKLQTLRFLYFIQTELGFRNLGLAQGVYPTPDELPFIPYHREGRRLQGLVRMTVNNILTPFQAENPVGRTGIAVGDYPIDHHHTKNPAAPKIDFPAVPSFSVPLGVLIPASMDNLLVADKAVSVTNIVNGSTRLQPVVIQLGQAAGALAALAIAKNIQPRAVPVREVQEVLLAAGVQIMPFVDVPPADPHFAALQRIGATGILQGVGVPFEWANRTWFYPDSIASCSELIAGLAALGIAADSPGESATINLRHLLRMNIFSEEQDLRTLIFQQWNGAWGLSNLSADRPLTRREIAVILDNLLDPFHRFPVNHQGKVISSQ